MGLRKCLLKTTNHTANPKLSRTLWLDSVSGVFVFSFELCLKFSGTTIFPVFMFANWIHRCIGVYIQNCKKGKTGRFKIVLVHVCKLLAVTFTSFLLSLCLEFGREISLWIESKRSATVTSTDYSQLFILTRSDLDTVLIRFPEVIITLATNAVASCLRVPSMTPALVGIDAKTSERIARRMAFSKQDFENGEIICLAGEDATVGYVIRAGKVNAEIGDGRLEVLSDLRCVGMTEIFAQERYQETVRAKGLVQAYRLTKQDIVELLSDVAYDFPRIQKVAKAHFQKVHRGHVVMRWSLLMNQRLSLEEDSCVSSARGLIERTSMFSQMANTLSRSDPDVFLDSAGRQVHMKKQPLEMVRIRSDLDESNT